MFGEMTQCVLQRPVKTSQPRFKRLEQLTSPDRGSSASTLYQPTATRCNGFDNSKENLYYETHLLKVRSACKLDETTIVSKYLGTIRKDYDEMAKSTAQQLATLKLRRKDIDFLKSRNKAMELQRQEVEQLILRREAEVAGMREKFEDAGMQTKTLDNIIARMKKDEIFYKQFGRLRDEQLHRRMKQHKFLEETLIHEQEKLQKLQGVMEQCKTAYERNRDQRERKYEDFSGRISDVRERDHFLQERKERTYELQSIELNDTLDQKNIHMRQIILAHKVADCLLEDKVAKLIQSYAHIQGAFHLVKAKTAISEPQLLTAKFFSYEETAESLLEAINEHEKRIEALTIKKAALTDHYQALLNENYAITDSKDQAGDTHNSTACEKQACIKEINKNILLGEEISQWVDRRLLELRPDTSIKSLSIQYKFKELCYVISQNVKKYQSIEWRKKGSLMGLRRKRGKEGDEGSFEVRQASQMSESNLIEEEYIRSSRQSIIKKGFSIKHFKRESFNLIK